MDSGDYIHAKPVRPRKKAKKAKKTPVRKAKAAGGAAPRRRKPVRCFKIYVRRLAERHGKHAISAKALETLDNMTKGLVGKIADAGWEVCRAGEMLSPRALTAGLGAAVGPAYAAKIKAGASSAATRYAAAVRKGPSKDSSGRPVKVSGSVKAGTVMPVAKIVSDLRADGRRVFATCGAFIAGALDALVDEVLRNCAASVKTRGAKTIQSSDVRDAVAAPSSVVTLKKGRKGPVEVSVPRPGMASEALGAVFAAGSVAGAR
ncbi:hypothetical protein JKP88DRAFT_286325 [Tribonema minus]|uniref:Histone H2B n=1 Tax=Tribonema minus TaxID=303371 RepID=A0A835ZBK6_9STRA|nr:hypothetical protein JKP88DRAFT_286325 [Tribonema minus]